MSDNVTLREYLDARITAVEKAASARAEAQDKAVSAAMAAAQAAVQKAEAASERRFEGVNEFRQSLDDQSRLLMPRAEFEALHKAMNERKDQVHDAIHERLNSLATRLNTIDSGRQGKAQGWSSVVSVVALIASVLGIVIIMLSMKT